MDKTSLLAKPADELIAIHNTIINRLGKGTPIREWKGKKEALADQVLFGLSLLAEMGLSVETQEPDQSEDAETAEEQLEVATAKMEATSGPARSGRTIREASLDLLCHVEFYEDKTKKSADDNMVAADHKNARSVGIAYDEIIRRVQSEFPGCDTSAACLRWYAVKVRVEEKGYEGLRLPQRRPRVKPTDRLAKAA